MPARDGTGPFGSGPMGRGMGPCRQGAHFWGRGTRPGGIFRLHPAYPQDEKSWLESEKSWLETQLQAVKERLQEKQQD